MNIVLLEPEIPFNTGAIGRTCVCTNSTLHLIRPLGFEISDKYLKRAGLDYWHKLDVRYYDSFQDFLDKAKPNRVIMATTKAHQVYSDFKYETNDYIMFGKESAGIPEEILVDYEDTCVRIPMYSDERSLNLSNSVSILLYEALRQTNFEGLNISGDLHRLKWNN